MTVEDDRCSASQPHQPRSTFLFTVPWKFHREVHPLGATPDDLIEVEADDETEARLTMNRLLGPGAWCSVITPDDSHSLSYHPGERIKLAPNAPEE